MPTLSTSVLLAQIEEEARQQGVDPNVAKAIFLSENSYHDKDGKLKTKGSVASETTSPKMAHGFMQVIPTTFKGLQDQGFIDPFADPNDPKTQIKAGVAAIKELNSRGIKNPREVAVAYNGGNAALKALRDGKPLNPETADYDIKFATHLTGARPIMATGGNTSHSERTSTTVHTRQIPANLQGDIARRIESSSRDNSDLQARLKQMAIDMGIDADKLGQAIDADVQADTQALAADTKVNQKINAAKENVLSTFGINLNDPNNVVVQGQEQIAALNQEQTSLVDQISTLKASSSITDPIGWLMNAFRQAPLIEKHNAIVMKKQNAIRQITQAQQLATNQAGIQVASLRGEMNDQMIAKANALITEGAKAKLQVAGAARAQVASTLIQTMQLNRQDITDQLKLAELTGNTTSTTTVTGDTTQNKEEDEKLKHVNLMMMQFGNPAFSADSFKALPKEIQGRLMRNAQFSPKTGEGFKLGGSPGEATAMVSEVFGRQGIEEMRRSAPGAGALVDLMVQEGSKRLDTLRAKAAVPGPEGTKAESLLKGAKDTVTQIELGVDLWYKDIQKDLDKKDFQKLDHSNPYKLNYGYVAQKPILKDNAFAQYVAKKPEGIRIDDNLLLGQAVTRITTGKVPLPQVAAELHAFYSRGHTIQRDDSKMSALGFRPIENYPIVAKVYSASSVDMFSQRSIENFLVSQVAAKNVSDLNQAPAQNMLQTPDNALGAAP